MNERLQTLAGAIKPYGLSVRGGFCDDGDETNLSTVLIGNLGGNFWPIFENSGYTGANSLDRWTKAVLDPVAQQMDAAIVYPFDLPTPPFLAWAQRAEGLQASPLGLLIHPDYGLWHAYRAAFLFSERLFESDCPSRCHPCETCVEKPCLNACPVGAFRETGYHVQDCMEHVKGAGAGECGKWGCLARKACPVGKVHEYSIRQQDFHMKAFLR